MAFSNFKNSQNLVFDEYFDFVFSDKTMLN